MAAITDLLRQITDPTLRERLSDEINRLSKNKKFGLVFEEHVPECTPLYGVPVRRGSTVARKTGKLNKIYTVKKIDGEDAVCVEKSTLAAETIPLGELVSVAQFGEPIFPSLEPIAKVANAPEDSLWHTIIEADNYHALQLLEYLYEGKVDCIYIDPPYNTGARDWKYNNDYVDSTDAYRHSKWLSMMQKRLKLAKRLLNPADSVLIVTIDEKEYLHLGCLLEELFSEARIQMVSSVINSAGVTRGDEFSRSNEFLYFVKIGTASPVALALSEEWRGHTKSTKKDALVWNQLMRSGTGARRVDRPNMFYPLYISNDGTKIIKIGEAIGIDVDRNSVTPIEGTRIVWPIRSNGEEGRWRIGRDTLEGAYGKGYVRLGTFTDKGMALTYLANGEQKKVENGVFKIIGQRDDGSLIEGEMEIARTFIPGTQWDIPSHNATYFGSQLLNKVLGEKRFDFPKSLYAVRDTLRFFVANKPNALIFDFFAGSGTTLHAVNLLNAVDGGKCRCILVTNNEVSDDEAKSLRKRGYQPSDEEWEKLGIARYVTWPRTICSIEGHDVNGNKLNGVYTDTEISMSEGFPANVEYFKLGFLDRNSVSLGQQFHEILPLLWLKAGAVGERPELDGEVLPDMLILTQNSFAVLLDEDRYGKFAEALLETENISMVYFVTNSEEAFREMSDGIGIERTYQLYRDYIDNFVIGSRRNNL